MAEYTCPYCGKENDVDEPYDYIDEREYECPECGKNFIMLAEYDPYITTYKADCLNGGEHEWRVVRGIPDDVISGLIQCRNCREEKRDHEIWKKLKEEEK